jgi:hypothetical protein
MAWKSQSNTVSDLKLLKKIAAMCPDVPYFIILLCLTPDNFTHQGEQSVSQDFKSGRPK